MGCNSSNAAGSFTNVPTKDPTIGIKETTSKETAIENIPTVSDFNELAVAGNDESKLPQEELQVAAAEMTVNPSASIAEAPITTTTTTTTANTLVPLPEVPVKEQQVTAEKVERLEPNLKKGYILKQGHGVKSWKNRFFVLERGMIRYFESSTADYPYGVKMLGEMSLIDAELLLDKDIITLKGKYTADKEKMSKRHNFLPAPSCIDAHGKLKDLHTEMVLEIRYPSERREWFIAFDEHIRYINPEVPL